MADHHPFPGEGYYEEEVLKGAIEGIRTSYGFMGDGKRAVLQPVENEISIFLLIHGKGRIDYGLIRFEFHEITVFVPEVNFSFDLHALHSDVKFLAIRMRLFEADLSFLENNKAVYPYFLSYADCIPYKEEIKSEKSMNRMLVPQNIVPRLSIGSVQTKGPDVVAAHEHPMLEQLFYGLEENHCLVHANEHEILFEDSTLLHIPLGSKHSVHVTKDHQLHYLWIDFFRNQEDMSYITESHRFQDTF